MVKCEDHGGSIALKHACKHWHICAQVFLHMCMVWICVCVCVCVHARVCVCVTVCVYVWVVSWVTDDFPFAVNFALRLSSVQEPAFKHEPGTVMLCFYLFSPWNGVPQMQKSGSSVWNPELALRLKYSWNTSLTARDFAFLISAISMRSTFFSFFLLQSCTTTCDV